MNSVFRTVSVAAALLVLVTLPMALHAQQDQGRQGGFGQRPQGQMGQDGRGGGFMMDRMAERLDLTDAQREQIEAIQESYRDQTTAVTEALGEVRREISDAVHAEPFDEGTIRAAASRLGELEADFAVHRARIMSEVRQVLTPEQIAKMDEMRERMHEWREGSPNRRGHGPRWRSGQRPSSGDDSG